MTSRTDHDHRLPDGKRGSPDYNSRLSGCNSESSDAARIVVTEDGSPTLFSTRFNQCYHNRAGAYTESRHVFFQQTGVIRALQDQLDFTVVETGFGTGFHVLMLESLRKECKSGSKIRFFSVEKYPVPQELMSALNFSDLFPQTRLLSAELLHFSGKLAESTPGQTLSSQLGNTSLHVYHGDFSDWDITLGEDADFFFHDAFSPDVNPDLWTLEVFQKLIRKASEQAVLGTYCSATRARAAMVLAGWHVARADGPPGKREMTLASVSEKKLTGYKRVNETRLKERFSGSSLAAAK